MVGVVQEKFEVLEPQEHLFSYSGRHFSLYRCSLNTSKKKTNKQTNKEK